MIITTVVNICTMSKWLLPTFDYNPRFILQFATVSVELLAAIRYQKPLLLWIYFWVFMDFWLSNVVFRKFSKFALCNSIANSYV